MDTYWALESTEFVGWRGEYNLFRIIAVCRTETEALARAKELSSKYGSLDVICYRYGEDIG